MEAVSQKVGNKRLLKLAAFLRTVPKKKFDYAQVISRTAEGVYDLSCGSTGCALGWASAIPSFRRLGFRSTRHGRVFLKEDPGQAWYPAVGAVFFGMSIDEASQLFSPEDSEFNATPKYVAKKIERFVKGRRIS